MSGFRFACRFDFPALFLPRYTASLPQRAPFTTSATFEIFCFIRTRML